MREIKTCLWCKTQFDLSKREREFLDKISPVFSSPSLDFPKGLLEFLKLNFIFIKTFYDLVIFLNYLSTLLGKL